MSGHLKLKVRPLIISTYHSAKPELNLNIMFIMSCIPQLEVLSDLSELHGPT